MKQPGEGGYVVSDPNIIVKELDLNSLASIKRFADDILSSEPRIDQLILNAGIMALPNREETEDGFEKQIGVNHFGHFYLTSLLRPKMESQMFNSRIIVLSSKAHVRGEIDLNDLHFSKGRAYSGFSAYGQSKLANILFAKSLADQFEEAKKHIKVMSVHPGVIATNLWKSMGYSGWIAKPLYNLVSDKTIPQVILSILVCSFQ